ncbi:MAG: amidase, partial [Candidatus Obscuribacterales bacterium]|nr:amidase [Candidatus Obscuribacterales bacterium]
TRLQHRASRTASIVHRLTAEGMIIIGKTHTVEFASGGWGSNQQMGTPWNPWDEKIARAPGGSSSGSAVAVAARLVPWAIGTDTGGSVRLPASWCGLTGLKPSSGRISTYGILPLSPSLDTVGPLTRSVEDAALLYQALIGHDPFDSRTLVQPSSADLISKMRSGIKGKRLALVPPEERETICNEVLAAYDRSIDILCDLGAKIVPFSPPFSFTDLAALNGLIMKTEAYSLYADFVDNKELPLDEDVRPRILAGKDVLARDYLAALRKRESMQEEFQAAMADIDAFLTPTTLTTAVPLKAIDQSTTPAHFTRFANFLDLCAIAVPNGISSEGLPTSLQIMGKRFDEAGILSIAWAFQSRTDWHEKLPEMANFSTKES